MSRLSMKGLGLVLALIKKMKTGDDINHWDWGWLRHREIRWLCCWAELVCTGAHQPSLPRSSLRHAVRSCESGGGGPRWTTVDHQPLRELGCDLQHWERYYVHNTKYEAEIWYLSTDLGWQQTSSWSMWTLWDRWASRRWGTATRQQNQSRIRTWRSPLLQI